MSNKKDEVIDQTVIFVGVLLRNGQKILACIPIDQMEDEKIRIFELFNPVEYYFQTSVDDDGIIYNYLPYIHGTGVCSCKINAEDIMSLHQLDEYTAKVYVIKFKELYNIIEDVAVEDPIAEKESSNVISLIGDKKKLH